MKSLRGFLLLALLLPGGCATWFEHPHPQVRRTLTVADAPDTAYARALRLTLAMGGTLWQHDAQLRMFQAYLNNAKTQLTVLVHPLGKGSQLEVTHQNLSTYFVAGDDGRLSDEFLDRYQHFATR
jgi:hypothetical protein